MTMREVTTLRSAFDASVPPDVVIEPGEVVAFTTSDSTLRRIERGDALTDEEYETLNLVAGPVYVTGAEAGDSLDIDILDVAIASAWVVWMEGFGPLGDEVKGVGAAQVLAADGSLDLGDGVRVPLDPMVGCIGVAPASGSASTLRPVYPTGGNLDLRALRPGTRISLPVEVEGGLLSLGDLHAAQGHGEPAFVAVEAAGTATVRVSVTKGARLPAPRLHLEDTTICVGMGPTFPEARGSAVRQAYAVLRDEHELSEASAYAYTCAQVGIMPAGPSGSMGDGLEAVLAVVPHPRRATG